MSSNTNPSFIGTALPGGVVNSNYVFDSGSNGISAVDISSNLTKINTPLMVNGRDVMREIDEMRDALLLLRRDVDMEAKYPKLKELKDAYEAQLEKYKTWEALK